MRLAQSLAAEDVNHTYEFAVEARAPEPLKLLPSQLSRHALSSEFARVCRQPIDGMYVIPSACDQFTWFGLLFIRRGIYGGGIFRFNVRIPKDFPNTIALPVVKFDLFIFHPNIDPTSRRPDLTRYFPDGWKKDKHHIQNVLLVVQRLFFSFDFDPETSANPAAATLWREDKEKFRSVAKNCVNQSRMEVYDEPEDANDPNVLRLTPWDPSLHEQVRDRMMLLGGTSGNGVQWEKAGKNSGTQGVGAGLSWLDTDAMTYMTESAKELEYPEIDHSGSAERDRVIHGIERLDLSGVQPENDTGESERSELSLDPVSLPSTASFSSPGHRKLERTNGHMESANTQSSSGEAEEVTDC
ncbi:unnamed protein product [Cylicocyclus nassatus]|uniref:UBC core domain-containing protein n=1 Tax=Cylicocyclus nassatus TaxID=53992 RepID=A0AA36DMX5_CYLNA|nr:unnamed protein product [Cylicocyclus nassatus]